MTTELLLKLGEELLKPALLKPALPSSGNRFKCDGPSQEHSLTETILSVTKLILVCLVLSPSRADAGVPAATQGTMQIVPLPQLVQLMQVIVTGKVIKAERQTIEVGVDRATCYVQVDDLIKGKPQMTTTVVQGKRIKAISFSYLTGQHVPCPCFYHDVGQDGLWFMSVIPPTPRPGTNRIADRINYSVWEEDRTRVEAVKKLLLNPGRPGSNTAPLRTPAPPAS